VLSWVCLRNVSKQGEKRSGQGQVGRTEWEKSKNVPAPDRGARAGRGTGNGEVLRSRGPGWGDYSWQTGPPGVGSGWGVHSAVRWGAG